MSWDSTIKLAFDKSLTLGLLVAVPSGVILFAPPWWARMLFLEPTRTAFGPYLGPAFIVGCTLVLGGVIHAIRVWLRRTARIRRVAREHSRLLMVWERLSNFDRELLLFVFEQGSEVIPVALLRAKNHTEEAVQQAVKRLADLGLVRNERNHVTASLTLTERGQALMETMAEAIQEVRIDAHLKGRPFA